MTKTELVAAIAAGAGISKEAAKKALDTTTATIAEAIKKGDKISLIGFGTFSTSTRAARTGVNPATGAKIQIAEKTVVKFKPSSAILG